MGPSLPQHAAFKVAKQFDNNGGITSPEASVWYGPTTRKPMLRFRDAIILLADERLYNAYKGKVEPARPVHTAMKAIALQVPLGDVLTKDGKQTYVEIEGRGITEVIQVDNRLLTRDNLNKTQQLIKAESNWQTSGKGGVFVTRMLEGNDQMSTHLPKTGWNNLDGLLYFLFSEEELRDGKLAEGFMKEYGKLQTYIAYQDEKVAGGLVSAGGDGGRFGGVVRRVAGVPHWLDLRPGVFIYRAAEGGAKVDAQATKETPKKLTVATPEMVKACEAAQKKIAKIEKTLTQTTKAMDAAIAELKASIENIGAKLQ